MPQHDLSPVSSSTQTPILAISTRRSVPNSTRRALSPRPPIPPRCFFISSRPCARPDQRFLFSSGGANPLYELCKHVCASLRIPERRIRGPLFASSGAFFSVPTRDGIDRRASGRSDTGSEAASCGFFEAGRGACAGKAGASLEKGMCRLVLVFAHMDQMRKWNGARSLER